MMVATRLKPSPVLAASTAKTPAETTKETPRMAQGDHAGRCPFVIRTAGGSWTAVGAVSVMVMSVRSREFLAAVHDPARDGVDRERDDEEDAARGDQDVDVDAERLGEGLRDVRGDGVGVLRREQAEGDAAGGGQHHRDGHRLAEGPAEAEH